MKNYKAEIEKIAKENHCRYCPHLNGDDAISYKCQSDVEDIVERTLNLILEVVKEATEGMDDDDLRSEILSNVEKMLK